MMRKGIVVAVHPEDHSVDMVMADDGSRLVGVQVMTGNGSTRTGTVDLPEIPKRDDKWDISKPTGQDMHAVVGYVGGNPVVTGFLFPQINQMTSTDPKLRMTRHQSDVVSTIDGDGNIQLTHPSGLFVRIGGAPDKVDYAGKNADADMAVDRNTSTTPYVRVHMAGGKAVLTIAPDGAVSLTTDTTVDVEAKGNVTVKTEADALVEAAGTATVKAPHVILDAINTDVTGILNVAGAFNVTGASEMTAGLTVNGDTAVKAITSNGKNISDSHFHVLSSGPSNGGPVG